MMFSPQQLKSLKLLEQFVAETPKHELMLMLNSFQVNNPDGITYAQYLDGLEYQMDLENLFFSDNPQIPLEMYTLFSDELDDSFCKPPPPDLFKITNQKDPEFFSGFFFIHLLDDGSKKSTIQIF